MRIFYQGQTGSSYRRSEAPPTGCAGEIAEGAEGEGFRLRNFV